METNTLVKPPHWGTLKPVAPGVVGIPILIVNAYMIGTKDNWVLVDAGLPGNAKRIKKAAETCFGEGAHPRAIVLTHGHFDHTGSLEALVKEWDVPVYAHSLELPYLTGKASYPPPDPTVGGGLMTEIARLFPTKPIDLKDRVRLIPSNGELEELPGWRIIHTPGHAPGHISLFRESDRVLIAGDAFVTTNQESFWAATVTKKQEIHRPPAYFTQDWDAARRSVEILASLEPSVVATGHGLPMQGPFMLKALHKLAENFSQEALPAKGRYVQEPARFSEQGVDFVPPPVADPVPKVLGMIGGAILAGIATYAWVHHTRNRRGIKSIL
ncbi:MBL fold metallo-hydrolase [Cytophagaceae bacterium DM2B3-1]|uniref:MBL fold metallo-hydrolase n=1 Tax=Xanthocytophaga flava TaxID=3048013 RepID=A0ABT7CNL2_9BACT|nr:MBL fold metallo-hydrolase [Xanthocytophaga flavus]MDJ1495311.1 MBL fold metallo-hydrolase [Xanthocytophaga flavus]